MHSKDMLKGTEAQAENLAAKLQMEREKRLHELLLEQKMKRLEMARETPPLSRHVPNVHSNP